MLGTPNVDRQTRRREDTRREILDAAWAVVAESGWSGLTQRAVAERVGMRAPSLYGHFASKMDIVDGMFGQAWAEYDADAAALEAEGVPDDLREALLVVGAHWLDRMTNNPERNALMNQRPVPGFVPSEDSYGYAVAAMGRLATFLDAHKVADPDAIDLWTAILAGLSSQQNANDPGGERWRRLLPRAVDMYLSQVAPGPRNRRTR